MILSALNEYYQHLLERQEDGISPLGYSQEKISYALILSPEGELLDVQDIRDTTGKKPLPSALTVPQPTKRSANIAPCLFWDKTSYVLGVTAKTDDRAEKQEKIESRTLEEHESFKALHQTLLEGETGPAMIALQRFLDSWTPAQFQASGKFKSEMLDANVVFRLDGGEYIHNTPAARDIRSRLLVSTVGVEGTCLVDGEYQPLARLHPAIKGVDGAQSSGASIVSFNLNSFTSYGKIQGNNAPISERVAFGYTTSLNHLLRRDPHNRQRLKVGDTTMVFWALADVQPQEDKAEALFADLLDPPRDDASETEKLCSALDILAKGRPLSDLDPQLQDSTRIYVLGLAPNASRLSVRFWQTGTLKQFAQRLAQHFADLQLEPLPWKTAPSIWRLLLATAPSRDGKAKMDDVPPQLAGEITRAILTGARYPRSLLTNIVMRMRADGEISPVRIALCKGVLARDRRLGVKGIKQEVPVSLDKSNTNPGYLLGRLFSELENAQKAALGKQINATIRDRYYGAASATPASVFPMLVRNAQHHFSKLRKGGEKDKAAAGAIERNMREIIAGLGTEFPRSLRIEAQGHFAIGYYHQSQERFSRTETNAEEQGE